MPTLRAPDSPLHHRIADALKSCDFRTVAELAEALGIGVRQLERVCRNTYGRTPKRLLNEQRLVRTLLTAKASGRRPLNASIDASYADYAHFCRECRLISGETPRHILNADMIDAVIMSLQL